MNAALDLRIAARSLRRRPGFTVAAIGTLGLGLGAATVLTTATRAALSDLPPYRAPAELVILRPRWTPPAAAPQELNAWSYPLFAALRDTDRELPALAAYTPNPLPFNFSADGVEARQARTELVSAAYLDILGVAPVSGRGLEPADDALPGGRAVALVSDDFWRAVLGGDPAAIGRTVRIEKQPYTVIGVMPPGFRGLSERAELWVPIATAPALTFPRRLSGSLSFWHGVVARVPDAERAALAGRLASVSPGLSVTVPLAEAFGPGVLSFAAPPLLEQRQDPALRRALVALSGAGLAVLLVAFVNVANLLLARVDQRRRELAVRVALGAGRAGLLRQALAESVLLALGAAGVALALVPAGLSAVRALAPPVRSGAASIAAARVDGGALAFAAVAAALAALALAALATRTRLAAAPAEHLRERSGGDASRSALRRVLVVVQLALVLALATVAGLLGKSLGHLTAQPLGFQPARLLTLRVDLPRAGYDDETGRAFFERAVARLAALPGVEAAAVANCLPLSNGCDAPQMTIAGRSAQRGAPGEAGLDVWMNMVDPAYSRLLGLPVLAGRGFTSADRAGAARVALVDGAAAERYWPGASPLGERIRLSVGWGDEDDFAEVVGVVGALPAADLLAQPRPGVYLSFAQYAYSSNYLLLKSRGEPGSLARDAERAIHELDSDLAVWDVATMDERVRRASAGTRFGALLLSGFGGLALVLAALGVYGLVAYGVSRRIREFGVRLALGSSPAQVVRQVLRETMVLAAIGIAVGIGAALAAARLVSGMIVTGSPYDLAVLAQASVLLALVAVVAGAVPAARAGATDPMRALRDE